MNSKKSFFGVAIGTMLEFYDSALFAIFLPLFSPAFFPTNSPYESLIRGYSILCITTITRPLGGLCFGYIGDFVGRRTALLGSMYGIAFATFAIGLTPSYAMIGSSAIVIIILAKSMQMFCFGGELNGAGIYVVEHAQGKRESLIGSLLSASTLFGSLLATLVGVVLTFSFMPKWSWRIAFIFGGIIGFFGIMYRKNLMESPHFKQAKPRDHGLMDMIKKFPRELLSGIFVGGLATLPFTTVATFINPVLTTKGYLSHQQFMLMQTLLMFIAVITLPLFGILGDKKSPTKVMQFSCLSLIIFCYPLLLVMDKGNLSWIILVESLFIIMNEMFLGPGHAYLKNLFPMEYRYRASSLSFCLGVSFVGGLTPLIENYLYQRTGHFSASSIWIIFITVCTFLSMHFARSKTLSIVFPDSEAKMVNYHQRSI